MPPPLLITATDRLPCYEAAPSPAAAAAPRVGAARGYSFTASELETLGRWYSALKYAIPELEASLVVSDRDEYSAIALRNLGGRRSDPTGMLFKYVSDGGRPAFVWITDSEVQLGPAWALSEITEQHLSGVVCPADDELWLNREGWAAVLEDRVVFEDRPASPQEKQQLRLRRRLLAAGRRLLLLTCGG